MHKNADAASRDSPAREGVLTGRPGIASESTEGPVCLVLVAECRELRVQAKVNRTANRNGTARVMDGTGLREWLLGNWDEQATGCVDFSSQGTIRIKLN